MDYISEYAKLRSEYDEACRIGLLSAMSRANNKMHLIANMAGNYEVLFRDRYYSQVALNERNAIHCRRKWIALLKSSVKN